MLAFLVLASRTARAQDTSGVAALTESDLRRRGAIIGGVAGLAVTGAVIGLFLARCRADTDDPCTGQSGFVVAAAAFGGTGALMGAIVGRFSSHWELRWPEAR
jgi:hypothetical protein